MCLGNSLIQLGVPASLDSAALQIPHPFSTHKLECWPIFTVETAVLIPMLATIGEQHCWTIFPMKVSPFVVEPEGSLLINGDDLSKVIAIDVVCQIFLLS